MQGEKKNLLEYKSAVGGFGGEGEELCLAGSNL
jgi:hypothetical protein